MSWPRRSKPLTTIRKERPLTTTEIITSRVISCAIFDPRKTIFKQVASSRSKCTTLSCTLQSCPLLEAMTCVQTFIFSPTACPYGSRRSEEGFTKRAMKSSGWISDRRKEYEGVPYCAPPAHKMAFIGDYVYLPYHHLDMKEAGLTLKYGCFLPRVDWTLGTVCKILDFRPRAWSGSEIISYRDEEVPKFLLHLRETDASMWQALIAERPALDTEPNHTGRKAILKTLNSPIQWSTEGNNYPVHWRWDGERVRTSSKNAYNSTWGGLTLDEVVIEGVPSKDAAVVIQENTWVNDETVFVD